MPRPSQSIQRKRALLPVLAQAFAELGYRRVTTAELARRCGLQETQLYRLWPHKKAMFLAALEDVAASSIEAWDRLLARPGKGSPAQRLLAHESEHHGESGLYRLVFAGLSETDDPAVRLHLQSLYERLQEYLEEQIRKHRDEAADGPGEPDGPDEPGGRLDPALAAWAAVGLGTVNSIVRELELLPEAKRRRLLAEVGRVLMDG